MIISAEFYKGVEYTTQTKLCSNCLGQLRCRGVDPVTSNAINKDFGLNCHVETKYNIHTKCVLVKHRDDEDHTGLLRHDFMDYFIRCREGGPKISKGGTGTIPAGRFYIHKISNARLGQALESGSSESIAKKYRS
jgi:hypothetical protein